MIMGLFAIQDHVGGVFHPPFPAHTPGTAERFVVDMVNDHNHPYSKHPGDYFLWKVGEYDDAQGLLVAQEPPERLLCLSQLVRSQG